MEPSRLEGTIPAMNAFRLIAIALTAIAAASGCATSRLQNPWLADGQELPILREMGGTFSSINRSLRLVIHDRGTLAMMPLEVGPVDFDREMVLVGAMGQTPSDDYSIRISRVWREGSELRAAVDLHYPPAGARLRATPASPFHAVIVPKCDLNVRDFDVRIPPKAFANQAGGGA